MDWEAFYNTFRQPDFISGYEIQNRLGGGAFGDVYKARKHSIGKAYAIKFLKIEDDSQREAVQRELSTVRHFAAIDHPNLVSIEDMGTVMEVPFLIMGYAGEDTLARRLKHGALAVDAALLYFVQACRGVLALHDRQLVHFDLKPSNIFLKGDVARVGDYGLSKLLTDGRMTLSYGRGTPQYMAPEMLRNRADHRADMYSLGVILYESLAGQLPFVGQTPGGLVIRETDEPPPFGDDFPAALRGPVERCLRLNPDDRYSSVEELLCEIEQTARPGDSVRLTVDMPAYTGSPSNGATTHADGQDRDAEEVDVRAPISSGESLADRLASARRAAAREAAALEEQGQHGVALQTRDPSSSGPLDLEPLTPSTGVTFRRTASQLAVGAARVARGVWDGFVHGNARASSPIAAIRSDAELQLPTGKPIGHGAVAAVRRAQQRLRGRPVDAIDATDNGALSAGAAADIHSAVQPIGGGALALAPDYGAADAMALHDASWLGVKAVPVPPRVEGGMVGTLLSTVVLALEILASLVGSLLRGTAHGLRVGGDRLWRSSGGLFSKALRLAFFVFAMALLGGLVMTAGMLFLGAMGAG